MARRGLRTDPYPIIMLIIIAGYSIVRLRQGYAIGSLIADDLIILVALIILWPIEDKIHGVMRRYEHASHTARRKVYLKRVERPDRPGPGT